MTLQLKRVLDDYRDVKLAKKAVIDQILQKTGKRKGLICDKMQSGFVG